MMTEQIERRIEVGRMSLSLGFSNTFDAIVLGELLKTTNLPLMNQDGLNLDIQPVLFADGGNIFSFFVVNGHRGHARDLGFRSRLYDAGFGFRRHLGFLNRWAMRENIEKLVAGFEGNSIIIFFQQDAATVAYDLKPDLPIVLYVANFEAFDQRQYRPYRGGLIGPCGPTLEKVRAMTGINGSLVSTIDDIMPTALAMSYHSDNRRRTEFFNRQNGQLKIVYLPSGSGVDLGHLRKMIEPLEKLLASGQVKLTVNFYTNQDQLRGNRALFSFKGVETICDSDREIIYKEMVEAVREAHLVITIANSYPRSFAGGPIIFLDTHVAGGIEKANFINESHYPGVIGGRPEVLLADLFSGGREGAVEKLRVFNERLVAANEEDPLSPAIRNWQTARRVRRHLRKVLEG